MRQLFFVFILCIVLAGAFASEESGRTDEKQNNASSTISNGVDQVFLHVHEGVSDALKILENTPHDIVAFATDGKSNMSIIEQNIAKEIEEKAKAQDGSVESSEDPEMADIYDSQGDSTNSDGTNLLDDKEASEKSELKEEIKNDQVERISVDSKEIVTDGKTDWEAFKGLTCVYAMRIMQWLNRLFVEMLKSLSKLYAQISRHIFDHKDEYIVKLTEGLVYMRNLAIGSFTKFKSWGGSAISELLIKMNKIEEEGRKASQSKLHKRGISLNIKQRFCKTGIRSTISPFSYLKSSTLGIVKRVSGRNSKKEKIVSKVVEQYGGNDVKGGVNVFMKINRLGFKLVTAIEDSFKKIENAICSPENLRSLSSAGSTNITPEELEPVKSYTERIEERRTQTNYYKKSKNEEGMGQNF